MQKIVMVIGAFVLICVGVYVLQEATSFLGDPSRHSQTQESAKIKPETPKANTESVPEFVLFGTYPQKAVLDTQLQNMGKERTLEQEIQSIKDVQPIEWRVLERNEDTVLLISRFCLDTMPYGEKNKSVAWADSSLRLWLNNEFANKAFTEEELADIVPYAQSTGSKTSQDKVALLSVDEAQNYLDEQSRSCVSTLYARKKKPFVNEETGASLWWLRTPGKNPENAAVVYFDGNILTDGYEVDVTTNTVRPCIRVKASSTFVKSSDEATSH